MQFYKYTVEEHSKLKYKMMAVRGHELEIRQKLAKEKPDLSIKKRYKYARMMANYAGLSQYGTFKLLGPYVPPKEYIEKSQEQGKQKERRGEEERSKNIKN